MAKYFGGIQGWVLVKIHCAKIKVSSRHLQRRQRLRRTNCEWIGAGGGRNTWTGDESQRTWGEIMYMYTPLFHVFASTANWVWGMCVHPQWHDHQGQTRRLPWPVYTPWVIGNGKSLPLRVAFHTVLLFSPSILAHAHLLCFPVCRGCPSAEGRWRRARRGSLLA